MEHYHSCSCSAVRTPHLYKGGASRQVRGKEKVEYRDKYRGDDRDNDKAKTKIQGQIDGMTETITNPKTEMQIFDTKNVSH